MKSKYYLFGMKVLLATFGLIAVTMVICGCAQAVPKQIENQNVTSNAEKTMLPASDIASNLSFGTKPISANDNQATDDFEESNNQNDNPLDEEATDDSFASLSTSQFDDDNMNTDEYTSLAREPVEENSTMREEKVSKPKNRKDTPDMLLVKCGQPSPLCSDNPIIIDNVSSVSSLFASNSYVRFYTAKGQPLDTEIDCEKLFTDDFFKNNYLVVGFCDVGSGSYGVNIKNVQKNGDKWNIDFEVETLPPNMLGTCDMAYWIALVPQPK